MVPFDPEALASHRRLVARMAGGDVEALQLLYLEFGSIVHGIARRVLADREDAREVVQDTFIRAWRQAARFREDRGEVVTWLVFIARRAAIDRVRKGVRRRALVEALRGEPAEAEPASATIFERRADVAGHLAELSPAQRQALELAFFSGCTQVEIAATMQIPVGNVKNHLRRGLLKLRQIVTHDD